ncbi:MAG TPA: NADH-quinone oxidoreductase subunit D [Anaerolineales bacterium]|nr:NADH-quinone oxidoreductase subunit D [Anaerolineae bacterium]HIQ00657.1 NADH-quinone oxidoreductase subunit D [Anaerolineales bacterium]
MAELQERFPGAAQPAPEPQEGLTIARDRLVEVATYLRDELGYAYLSNITSVDYPEGTNGLPPRFEVVYHLYQPTGGPLVLHVHADREDPAVPSLAPLFPSANFQEREAWDLMGIRFEGHPDLRRILLWEGFDGHPLRKDWHEPYYEEDHKPFSSRFPEGRPMPAEERTLLRRNLRYPPGWSPRDWRPMADTWGYTPHDEVAHQKNPTHPADRVVLNMGPHHPSTHGVLRLLVTLEGETIQKLEPMFGFLHRCHEKIGERNTWLANMPYTDRLDYVCSMSNNLGYAIAVEKLLDVEVPERAEYIRVIMAEFTRFLNHAVSIGFTGNDLGIYFTAMLYALEEREFILDLFEMTAGSRMMCNYMRFGGVAHDMTDEAVELARELAFERLPRFVDKLEAFLTDNELFRARTVDVGVLPPEQAIAYGCTGPLLRASGVPYDVRRAEPYSIYDQFDFDVVVGTNGDAYDRYLVRVGEMRQSLRILQQALNRLPGGPVMAGKKKATLKVPAGEAYGRIEAPKGEMGFYIISDGGPNPYRYHIRAPSFINLGVMGELCRGHLIADVVIILASIDITLGEVDR